MKEHTFTTFAAVMLCVGAGVFASAQEGDTEDSTDAAEVTKTSVSEGGAATGTDGEGAGEEQKDAMTVLTENVAKRRAEIEETVKLLGEIKDPRQSKVNRFERTRETAEENLKNVEKFIESIRRLSEEYDALISKDFELTKVSREQLDAFLAEAETALTAAIRALSDKSEGVRLTGLDLFEKTTDKYRGASTFAEALKKYSGTIAKFEKKWSRMKNALERNRSKISESAREKSEASEEVQVSRLEQRMKAAGKDFNKDWFIPLSTNSTMLERACERVKVAMKSVENMEKDEEIGTLPQKLQEYWDTVEKGINLMRSGEYDDAEALFKDVKVHSGISSLPDTCLPQEMRRALADQVSDLCSEIRNRRNEARRSEQKRNRDEMNAQRALDMTGNAIDRMRDDLADMQEDAKRREEEQARRREEEDEARLKEKKEADGDDEEEKAESPAEKTTKQEGLKSE